MSDKRPTFDDVVEVIADHLPSVIRADVREDCARDAATELRNEGWLDLKGDTALVVEVTIP